MAIVITGIFITTKKLKLFQLKELKKSPLALNKLFIEK